MADFENEVFGWDDEVEEASFSILPEGDYKFTVVAWERGRFEPKDPSKGPACDQATLHLRVEGQDEDGKMIEATIFHRLRLRKKEVGFIRRFFDCIGLASNNGTAVMPWNKIEGESGICEIEVHEYNGKRSNQVKQFYERSKAPKVGKNFSNMGTGAAAPKSSEPTFDL